MGKEEGGTDWLELGIAEGELLIVTDGIADNETEMDGKSLFCIEGMPEVDGTLLGDDGCTLLGNVDE